MADEEGKLESTQEQPEAEESPTPSVPSVVSGDTQPSETQFDPDALASKTAEKLRPMIQEEVARSFQSGKDVRYASVEKIHSYLEAAGGDVAKATRDMKLDEIYERLDSEGEVGAYTPGSGSDEAFMEARTGQLLRDAGIDFEDPDYKMLVAQYGGRVTDANQWISVVEGFTATRQSKRAKQENIPGAAAASEGGNVISAEDDKDIETLTQELNKLQALPATAETMEKRKELRKRLSAQQDKIGLLDNVKFDSN